VDMSILPIFEPDALAGLSLLSFTEAPALPAPTEAKSAGSENTSSARFTELEKELERLRAELQYSRGEMQTSQEKLKSANEELQSTNEELTISKEEMQSLNEELQTINQELQAKVDELSLTSNDMKNLLDSTDIAILFLDQNLNVRRFTPQVTKIFKLIPGDAGRPITDVKMNLDYPGFIDDIHEVLRTLDFRESQITTRDGQWFLIRIMPYRTIDNVVDGVVMTCSDITVSKQLENKLRSDVQIK